MRTLLGSLVTSGGMLAGIAFFLPWIAMSCNDNTLGTMSPYQRAAGMEAEVQEVHLDNAVVVVGKDGRPPAVPAYWLLLAIAVLLAVTGVAIALVPRRSVRRYGAIALMAAGIGLWTTVTLGLGDKLGIEFGEFVAPGFDLRVSLQPGVWISVAAYSLGLSGSIATLLFGTRAGA